MNRENAESRNLHKQGKKRENNNKSAHNLRKGREKILFFLLRMLRIDWLFLFWACCQLLSPFFSHKEKRRLGLEQKPHRPFSLLQKGEIFRDSNSKISQIIKEQKEMIKKKKQSAAWRELAN